MGATDSGHREATPASAGGRGTRNENGILAASDPNVMLAGMVESEADWSARDTEEIVRFFQWMDALCREARQRGRAPPWPRSDGRSQDLNHWITGFDRGETPTQALDGTITKRPTDSV